MPPNIPERKWSRGGGMDFIMELSLTKNGYTSMLVLVDRLTKTSHLVPTTTNASGEGTIKHYVDMDNVFRHHGLQEEFASNFNV